jgi:hypothetical protein
LSRLRPLEDQAAAIERLAKQLVTHCGAPNLQTAKTAAEEEVEFAASLCDHPEGTLLGLHRSIEDGGIRESFRTLHRRADRLEPIGAFRVVEVDEEDPAEEVDLLALAEGGRR